jgi:TonB family protein
MRFRSFVIAILTLVLGIANASIAAEAGDAEWDGWAPPKLPHFTFPNESFYPVEALRRGVEGRVLVGFDITTDGKAKNISVIWAEDQRLADAAQHMMSTSRFDVPADWASSGAWQRWRAGFVFCMVPGKQSGEFAIPVDIITVRGSRTPNYPRDALWNASRMSGSPESHPSTLCAASTL